MSDTPRDLSRLHELSSQIDSVDEGLLAMLPDNARELLAEGPAAIAALLASLSIAQARVASLTQQLSDLDAGIREYADQTGQGQLLLDNLRLCLDQVRNRKQQGLGI